MEGVRARGHPRQERQLRGHLHDREPRSDGRPHGRLDHGRSGDDAHRQGVPEDARRRARHHHGDRGRDRRIEHPVRGRAVDRPAQRHRDEPSGLALERPRVEGHGLPDREDRGEARRRVSARRAAERHHGDERSVRACHRLRRREDAALRVREVPGVGPAPDDADEVGRRSDGDRAHVQGGAPEGVPLARDGARRARVAARSDRLPRARGAGTTPSRDGRALEPRAGDDRGAPAADERRAARGARGDRAGAARGAIVLPRGRVPGRARRGAPPRDHRGRPVVPRTDPPARRAGA